MSRSSLREDSGRPQERTGIERTSTSNRLGTALKRDAHQFLNSAEYEFRKVVGASRTAPTPQEPNQAPPREATQKRKQDTPLPEADRK